MSDSETFAKKIKELTHDEIQYTDDFFAQAFGDSETSFKALKQSAQAGAKRNITDRFSDEDIDEEWLESQPDAYSGQLAVDVFQTDDAIIITSAVAGLRAEDLDISMNGEMITIRGIRHNKFAETQGDDYFIRECYWGGFSRSIILPVDIIHDQVSAKLENGILTVTLPKAQRSRNGKIPVVEA